MEGSGSKSSLPPSLLELEEGQKKVHQGIERQPLYGSGADCRKNALHARPKKARTDREVGVELSASNTPAKNLTGLLSTLRASSSSSSSSL